MSEIIHTINPKVAGIYITRKCNLNCGYCAVRDKVIEELDVDQWLKVISILESIGIEKLTILGGEPTMKEGLDKIIYHLAHNTNLDFSITSNGVADFEILQRFVDAGLKRFSSSVDTLHNKSLDISTSLKSQRAIENFEKLNNLGVEHLTAYFVLSAITLPQVIDVVKYLSERNVWLYILPYHYGKQEENFWETRAKTKNTDLALGESDKPYMTEVMDILIHMRKNGYLISNSEEYLRNLPEKIVDFKWHCENYITELRIDADGSLMCCHDNKGELSSKYNIFDIADKEKFEEFKNKRAQDAQKCPGCYWPSQYHSIEYIKNTALIEGVFIE